MNLEEFLEEWHSPEEMVLVHTSGSTGKPKPMLVEKQRMLNSARITCDFLDLHEDDNALLCMPLDYIAGKMMVVRSLYQGMNLISVEPSNHPLEAFVDDDSFHFELVAMVPSQVYCSLQVPEERAVLRRIRHLIIGGGAINDALAHELQLLFSPEECDEHFIWSTYGMTETLSHVAIRRLNGNEASDWYTPFDNVEISLNEDNCLVINAPLVHDGLLVTNDIAEIRVSDDSQNQFRIIGRKDNVICSGGIKLQIEQIEDALRPYLQSPKDESPSFCITKVPDEKFGEATVLLTLQPEPLNLKPDPLNLKPETLPLPSFQRPKYIFQVDHIPLTPTGKIDRQAAQTLAATMQHCSIAAKFI